MAMDRRRVYIILRNSALYRITFGAAPKQQHTDHHIHIAIPLGTLNLQPLRKLILE